MSNTIRHKTRSYFDSVFTKIKIDTEKGVMLIEEKHLKRPSHGDTYQVWQFGLDKHGQLELYKNNFKLRWKPDTNLEMWKQAEDLVVEHYNKIAEQILLEE